MKFGFTSLKLVIGNKWSNKDSSRINFNDNFKPVTILNWKNLNFLFAVAETSRQSLKLFPT